MSGQLPITQPAKTVCVGCQVICGKVSVPPHHLRTRPAPHLLKDEQGRAALHVPAGPGVPKVVPPKVFDARALQCRIPGLRTAEHMRDVFPQLLGDHCDRFRIERHRYRLARSLGRGVSTPAACPSRLATPPAGPGTCCRLQQSSRPLGSHRMQWSCPSIEKVWTYEAATARRAPADGPSPAASPLCLTSSPCERL